MSACFPALLFAHSRHHFLDNRASRIHFHIPRGSDVRCGIEFRNHNWCNFLLQALDECKFYSLENQKNRYIFHVGFDFISDCVFRLIFLIFSIQFSSTYATKSWANSIQIGLSQYNPKRVVTEIKTCKYIYGVRFVHGVSIGVRSFVGVKSVSVWVSEWCEAVESVREVIRPYLRHIAVCLSVSLNTTSRYSVLCLWNQWREKGCILCCVFLMIHCAQEEKVK